MNPDLPYIVEYSKSNRASCKICKSNIGKDILRIGVMVQSQHFDGKVPMWHHTSCYFQKKTISDVAEIANFDNLRWDDQKKIKENIAKGGSKSKGGSGKSEFSIEYAKSSRAVCKTCDEKIMKGTLRISKLDKDGDIAKRFGPVPGWRHVDCFVKDRLELNFPDSAAKLPGFDSLEEDDRKMVLGKIGKLEVKRKGDELANGDSKKLCKEDKLMKAQNVLLFDMRDKLKASLSKKELVELLEFNNQHVSPGEHNNRDNLSDCLVFGAIKLCPECKNSTPRYKIDGYRCSGNVTEWTKCQYFTRCPEREPFKIPDEYKEKYEFLQNYKYVKRDRILPEKEDSKTVAKKLPLNGFIIAVFEKLKKKATEKIVIDLGGAISSKVNSSVQCCISTESDVGKGIKNVETARKLDIHIVSEKFLEDVKNGATPAIAIKDNLICSWGGDPILKLGIKKENAKSQDATASTSKSTSKSSKSGLNKSGIQKIKVSGAAAVDPDSGKEDTCHVYQKKDNVYNCVLGMVDLSRSINTYYKLQILEENRRQRYYLFRSWGRVGTEIGNNKIEDMPNADEAIKQFQRLYLDKTGNEWADRKNFVKKPGAFYPLDIDYGQEATETNELKPDVNCKLPKPVQELICLIFDIEAMKKAMVEFEIDLKKMPLGKLSKKQIEQAYSVLNEAQQIIVTGCNATKILDASNKFYTLIPHDFGLRTPPLLDNEELIKSKIEMLDSLLEIEFAYNLMKSESASKDAITEHYEKLQTDIDVLDENSEEYNVINKYMKNTHAETHNHYKLKLNKVFKINRHGESERYNKFKNLHNKKLLWHGSRLTNFVGILSQGLRIAPPEAPATGYMFGKGIYFADMVSKSANYCVASRRNPTALMLLCEVALGNMYEKLHSEYVVDLPKNKHSTKGLGMTIPDPKDKTFIGDVEVPYGMPKQSHIKNSSLLYNEYIVYDVSQVNIKYLLEVSFNFKSGY